jgi:HJR/Mrr/RecB family endonuclease
MGNITGFKCQLQQLNSDEFESLVASLWSEMGWSTKVTSGSRDQGIDVIANKSGVVVEKVVIQAKCYSEGNTRTLCEI